MSKIEWTHIPGYKGETWNPVVGCSVVSPGCANCYAMDKAGRHLDGNPTTPHYDGTTTVVKRRTVWTGKVAEAPDRTLTAPLRWRKPRAVFVNSMGDLFHEKVPDLWIDRVFAVMALCPQHIFMVLTKRPARMRAYLTQGDNEHGDFFERLSEAAVEISGSPCAGHVADIDFPLPNVWLGASAEDQRRADERIRDLLATTAAVRFVSFEPLLGAVDLTALDCGELFEGVSVRIDALSGYAGAERPMVDLGAKIDWVIAGGESGRGARPMHPDWVRALRDQCAEASTPFFFKQWGAYRPSDVAGEGAFPWGLCGPQMARLGKAKTGATLDGAAHRAFPAVDWSTDGRARRTERG